MENRQLWLLRHAKAEHNEPDGSDVDRPLTASGKQDALHIGEWMAAQGLVPDRILCSNAKRTRQTIKRVCQQLGCDPDDVHFDVRLYLASRAVLLEDIAHTGLKVHRLLVVGHNPGLEDLLRYLCPEPLPYLEDQRLLTPGSLACIALPEAWRWLQKGNGRLLSLIRPKDLPAR